MPRSLARNVLALAFAFVASLVTARAAHAQCQMGPSGGGGDSGTAGPSARFLYDPLAAGRNTCVYSVSVTPDDAVAPTVPLGTSQVAAVFTVRNTGSGGANDNYVFSCGSTGVVQCLSVKPQMASVVQGGEMTDTVFYTVGPTAGTGRAVLHATGTTVAADTGWYNVTSAAGNPPNVSLAGLYTDVQDLGRCAANCFQVSAAQSTVPYFSLGAPQSVSLSYRQDRAHPRGYVHVDVQQPGGATTFPTRYWLQAKLGQTTNVVFMNGETTLKFAVPSGNPQLRLGGEFDFSAWLTGIYAFDVTVTAEFTGGATFQKTVNTLIMVVNDSLSPIARGWTLAGIQRITSQAIGSDKMVTDGAGAVAYFQYLNPGYASSPGDFSQLFEEKTNGLLSGYTRRYPDSTRVWFDLNGYMTKATDAFGNTTQIGYDGSMRVSTITDPMNRAITLGYDANGLHTITDPGGRVTTVTVNASKQLTQITDPDTKHTNYGYDANARLATVTNRAGKATTFGYGSGWELASITGPAVTVFGSGTAQSPVSQFEAWQIKGVPFTATATTPFNPPTSDTIYARVTEPGGAKTKWTVDQWGQPLKVTDPLGNVRTVTYDGVGLLSTQVLSTYRAGTSDQAAGNAFGLFDWVQPAGGPRVNFRFAAYAQADSMWGGTSDSLPSQRRYIGLNGRVDSVRVGKVVRQRTWYDTRGRVDSIVDGKKHFSIRYHYDATTGNVSSTDLPAGLHTTYTYDTFGRPTTTKSPGFATQTTYYGLLNRVDSVKTTDGVTGRTVKYGYDELLLRSVTDPLGQVDSLFYNDLGWKTREKDPAGASLQYAYSIDGDLKQFTNRRGQAITYLYDALHRPTQKSGTNTDLVTWGYSVDSLRTITAASPVSTETSYFNVRGQPDSVKTVLAGQTFWRRYRYRALGQLVTDTVSGGGIATWQPRQYAYDSATAMLTSIKLGTQVPTALAFDSNLVDTSAALPGNDVLRTTMSTLQRPLDIKSTGTYAGYTNRLLALDPGARLQRHYYNTAGSPVKSTRFTYDSLGQVVGVDYQHWTGAYPQNCFDAALGYTCAAVQSGWTTDSSDAQGYDLAGNRSGGTYGPANRVTSWSGCTYTTDADGDVTGRTGCTITSLNATFTWSAEGQLKTITQSGKTQALQYDAAGLLVRWDTSGTAQRHFVWDGGNLLGELDKLATTKLMEYSYYPGLDNPHALIKGTTTYFPQLDGVGNVIALTDATQRVKATYGYSIFGHLTSSSDSVGFGGTDRPSLKGALHFNLSNTHFYYMRNRWYESRSGRFLSEDPIGLAGGLNLYAYAGNDPVNGSDPLGLDYCPDPQQLSLPTICVTSQPDPFFWERVQGELWLQSGPRSSPVDGWDAWLDRQGRAGGGRRAGPAHGRPKPRNGHLLAAPQEGCGQEVVFTAGLGGSAGGSPFVAMLAPFLGGSVSVGVTSRLRVVLVGQGYGAMGLGAYFGGGFQGGVQTVSDLPTGLSGDASYVLNANVGFGESAGASVSFKDLRNFGLGGGGGRIGAGWGVEVSAGVSGQAILASPALISCK